MTVLGQMVYWIRRWRKMLYVEREGARQSSRRAALAVIDFAHQLATTQPAAANSQRKP